MRKMVGNGIIVALLGGIMLIAGIGGHILILDEPSADYPSELTAPCGGLGQDAFTCFMLTVMTVLWASGIVVIVIGVGVAIVGSVNKRPQPVLQQPTYAPVQQPPSYTCPTCGYCLTWMAPEQKYYCGSCGKYP
ncbi:MAG: hypothetical protein ACW99U_18075 [Candidatus Thorarchaeota archaeon]|jgi:hypothetical protein